MVERLIVGLLFIVGRMGYKCQEGGSSGLEDTAILWWTLDTVVDTAILWWILWFGGYVLYVRLVVI